MRPRPIEVHPHSKGSKHFVVQDVIANYHRYFFVLMNGQQKTDLYNTGVLDGRKKSVPFYTFKGWYQECEDLHSGWLLAIPKDCVKQSYIVSNESHFIGRSGIERMYILKMDEIMNFMEYTCSLGECPYAGQRDCYKNNSNDCSTPDRARHVAGRYSYA